MKDKKLVKENDTELKWKIEIQKETERKKDNCMKEIQVAPPNLIRQLANNAFNN